MSILKKFSFTLFIFSFATKILAQDFVLDQITVSANKINTPISQTGTNISIINKDAIGESTGNFFSEIIDNATGVTVYQSGPVGTITNIYTRGFGNKYSKIYYNGIEMSDITAPQVTPEVRGITSNNLNKIEILQGSQSALYGSEAIGGTYFLESEKIGQSGNETNVGLEYGSYNTRKFNFSTGRKYENGFISLSYSNYQTDGFTALEKDIANPEDDGFSSSEILINSETDLKNGTKLKFNILNILNKGDYDNSFGGTPIERDVTGYYYDQNLRGFNSLIETSSNSVLHKLSLNSLASNRTEYTPFGNYDYYGTRTNLDYQAQLNPSFGNFVLGVGAVNDVADIDDKKKEVTTISTYSSILTKPTDNSTFDITVRLDSHSKFGNKTTGRIAATYKPTEDLTLKVGGGTGFRAPSLYELFTQWGGNSKLKPENSTNIDAGLNYVLVNSGLELQASVFNTEVKDEIIYSFSEGYSQSVNSTKRQGLSVGFDYKISDLSKINLRYSTTTDEKGNNVSRIPKNSISLNGQTILFGKLSISGNLKVVRDLEESGEKMEDYNLLNSKLNYPLTDNTQLTLSAENLLDENYETAKGYSTSKRAFYLGYNAKF